MTRRFRDDGGRHPDSVSGRRDSSPLLEVRDLAVAYLGVVQALHGVSLKVQEGEVVAVLGANGAGKTTLLRTISGLVPGDRARITKGEILLDTKAIHDLPPHRIAALGIGLAPERNKIFQNLTVQENLELGLQLNSSRASRSELRDVALQLFPILKDRNKQTAGYLSGGERQMLAIATVLLTGAKLLLLDEISLGLAPALVSELIAAVGRLNRDYGLSMLVVDQNISVAHELAHQVYVLENGRFSVSGAPSEVLSAEAVADAYLGMSGERPGTEISGKDGTGVSPPAPILATADITLRFGGVTALRNVSLSVPSQGVFGLIGPNGAGKSSLLNCINGFYRPQSGAIIFDGKDITKTRPHVRAKLGLGRTFQNLQLSTDETVLDNVLLGRHLHMRSGLWSCALYWGPVSRSETANRRRAEEILDLLGIVQYKDRRMGSLPYGHQKLVDIARALAMEPKLLLLDEPASGMTRPEKDELVEVIMRIKSELDITQVIIEHDVQMISECCHMSAVLNFGVVIAEGETSAVVRDPDVRAAYIGHMAEEG